MLEFTKKEKQLFKKLNTPAKVQDFLNTLKFNFEPHGDTIKSPINTLRVKKAHCFEGALLGAYILSLHGHKPYIMYLKSVNDDLDHVIAPFKVGRYWGALSKTNHSVLRYREPVYRDIRELAMSYFHEYFLNDGRKTLRQYSGLINLNDFEEGWEASGEELWGLDEALNKAKHFETVPKLQARRLRKADKIEIKAGKIAEWKK